MAQRSRSDGVRAYIGLGGNVGQPRIAIQQALAAMDASGQCHVVRVSSLYRSAPVDAQGPDFINAVAAVDAYVSAPDLLALLQTLEFQAGRERPYRNAPRTLDLDVLLYGNARIHSAQLVIPHPRMLERAFVMLPLAEIAPEWSAPADATRNLGQAIARCTD